MSDLWAITTCFNPRTYRSRPGNHRVFRKHLSVPLLAVELAFGDEFVLTKDDADLLVQVHGGAVLWQKERLLNIALSHLPDECRYVAWIDGDVIFEQPDWPQRTRVALEQHAMLQLFTKVFHFRRDAVIEAPWASQAVAEEESFASQWAGGRLSLDALHTTQRLPFNPGHAWAMRRDMLGNVGFYDAAIIGGATLLMAATAVGCMDGVVARFQMTSPQAAHYLAWAKRFHDAVGGRVGVVEGTIAHLWHGELKNRGYGVRFARLREAEFDPSLDIAASGGGAWKWSSDKPGLHKSLQDYFEGRQEDGGEPSPHPAL